MKIEGVLSTVAVIAILLAVLLAAYFSIELAFADDVSLSLDTSRPEARTIVEGMVGLAPSDPQTHFVLGSILEQTFDQNDLVRSLQEYEKAAGLAPENYTLWLSVGRVRGLLGDNDGANDAYERALALAPNYSVVLWTYGNALLRQGETQRGFEMMARAAISDPQYSQPAVITSLQIFGGNTDAVRAALGDSDVTNATLAAVLASQGDYDGSIAAWQRVSAAARVQKYQPLCASLIEKSLAAKHFRAADLYVQDLADVKTRPQVGQLTDGGFEAGVKLRDAGPFEWKIADGSQPQVGLSESQKRSGTYSLQLAFNTTSSADFREISQYAAVEPGRAYSLEIWYRSDVKSSGAFKWDVVDMTSNSVIASTPVLAPAADWTRAGADFKVPVSTDGIMVRLSRDGCAGPTCPTNGRLMFDDISLQAH